MSVKKQKSKKPKLKITKIFHPVNYTFLFKYIIKLRKNKKKHLEAIIIIYESKHN